MAKYVLRVMTYEAPDRGDPYGGWRSMSAKKIQADNDEIAAQKASAYLKQEYSAPREDVRAVLYCTRVVPLEVAK